MQINSSYRHSRDITQWMSSLNGAMLKSCSRKSNQSCWRHPHKLNVPSTNQFYGNSIFRHQVTFTLIFKGNGGGVGANGVAGNLVVWYVSIMASEPCPIIDIFPISTRINLCRPIMTQNHHPGWIVVLSLYSWNTQSWSITTQIVHNSGSRSTNRLRPRIDMDFFSGIGHRWTWTPLAQQTLLSECGGLMANGD